MTKVVINDCYGGFSLSTAAVIEYYKRKGKTVYVHNPRPDSRLFGPQYWLIPIEQLPELLRQDSLKLNDEQRQEYNRLFETVKEHYVSEYDLRDDEHRTDPDLVAVVEQLGKEANGAFASLNVVEIPDDVEWQIEEYDGVEWVAEKHRTWS